MAYFLSPHNLTIGHEFEIDGEEAVHVMFSRRIKVGEILEFQGPDGYRYASKIIAAKKNFLVIKTLEQTMVPDELKTPITLFQAIVSEKSLDFIFQKGTELGLFSIVLFNAQNTPLKLTEVIFQAKVARWEKILWEAAKQSGRGTVPQLYFIEKFEDVIKDANFFYAPILLDHEGQTMRDVKNTTAPIAYIVGPEGGLSLQEKEVLNKILNIQTVKISNFMLRAETAALAGLVFIQGLL